MPPSEHLLPLWKEWRDGEERRGPPRFCLKLPAQSKQQEQLKKRSELLLLCAKLSPLMVESFFLFVFFSVGRVKELHKRLAADPKILLSGKLTYRVNESVFHHQLASSIQPSLELHRRRNRGGQAPPVFYPRDFINIYTCSADCRECGV